MKTVSWDILITIFIFFAGYLLNTVIAAIRKYRECVLTKVTFVLWTSKMIESLGKYSSEMKSMANEIKNSDSWQPITLTTHLVPLEPFYSYPLNLLTEVFVCRLHNRDRECISKASTKLYAFLTLIKKLSALNDMTQIKVDEYRQEFKRLATTYNDVMYRFSKDLKDNLSDSNLSESEKSLYDQVISILQPLTNMSEPINPKDKKDRSIDTVSMYISHFNRVCLLLNQIPHSSLRVKSTYDLSLQIWKVSNETHALKIYGDHFQSITKQIDECIRDLRDIKEFWMNSSIIKWYSYRNLTVF